MKNLPINFVNLSIENKRLKNWLKIKREQGAPLIFTSDVLCFCTGLTKAHFDYLVETATDSFTLDDLKLKTRAGYHCFGCQKELVARWNYATGLRSLKKPSEKPIRSKVTKDGRRQMYLGHYPLYWIVKIHQLEIDWRKQEDFAENFNFEIIDAPVPYVDFRLNGECDPAKAQIYFSHFVEYVKNSTKAQWYFNLL